MTRSILILAALFAFGSLAPETALANNRVAATKKAAPAKAGSKAKAKSNALRARRVGASMKSGAARLGRAATGSLKLRSQVRVKNQKARAALSEGRLNAAAKALTKKANRNEKGQFTAALGKLSIRERFALWRTTRKVKRTAAKQARGRAKKGDLHGADDALKALATLEAGGKLGPVSRWWHKARTNKKVFKITAKKARKSLRSGEVDAAGAEYVFAAGIKPGSRQSKKLARPW